MRHHRQPSPSTGGRPTSLHNGAGDLTPRHTRIHRCVHPPDKSSLPSLQPQTTPKSSNSGVVRRPTRSTAWRPLRRATRASSSQSPSQTKTSRIPRSWLLSFPTTRTGDPSSLPSVRPAPMLEERRSLRRLTENVSSRRASGQDSIVLQCG